MSGDASGSAGLRRLARWLLEAWYPRLVVRGGPVPEGPLVVAANHPNSLVDPVLLSVVLERPLRWLAKAPLFANPIARRLLLGLGAVPVRRAHEGGTEEHREALIESAAEVLVEGGALGIFPEGRTHDEARLSPLKTGVGRIAVRAAERLAGRQSVRVLPVVLHFPEKTRFRSEAVVALGEALVVEAGDDPRAVTAEVARRLEEHLVHVEDDEQERLLLAVRAIDGPRLARELSLCGPAERHVLDREIARAVRRFSAESPREVEAWKHRALAHLDRLQASGLSVSAVDPQEGGGRGRFLLAVLGLPLALWGALHSWLPYRFAGWHARRSARREGGDNPAERATIASFGLLGGLFAFPLAWLLESVLVGSLLGWAWALAFLATAPISALVARRVAHELRALAVRWRDRALVGREPELRATLEAERASLRADVDRWRLVLSTQPGGDGA